MEPVWTPCPDPPFFLPPPLFLLCSSYCFRINPAWFPYCFRILSVLFPLLEARMIEQRKKEERRKNEGRYGNNTGLIRDRYENGLFRLPSEVIDKKFNLFIIISFDYILHFSHLPLSAVYAKKASSPFTLAQPLYKDNLPFSWMQAD